MARNPTNLEDLYVRLNLEEEEGGVIVGNGEIQEHKDTYILVGKFLTEKNINFGAMQNVLASLWRPKEGMEVHDIGDFKYSFVFYHIMDLHKVLEGGPWSFEQNMLVYSRVNGVEEAQNVDLSEMDIWVQIYDIPTGMVTENILKSVEMYIEKFVKVDATSLNGS